MKKKLPNNEVTIIAGKGGMQRLMEKVACSGNLANLQTEFQNGVGSTPVRVNSPSVSEWIVSPPVIKH